MSSFRIIAVLVLALQVAACGFQPLYGRRDTGSVQAKFTDVVIDPIEDRVGQQLRNHLVKIMQPRGRSNEPKWRLNIEVTEGRRSLAVRKSAFATRAALNVNASVIFYSLTTGSAAVTFTSTVSSSFNIFTSEFATVMAEKDAREKALREIGEDIRVRIGAFLNDPNNADVDKSS